MMEEQESPHRIGATRQIRAFLQISDTSNWPSSSFTSFLEPPTTMAANLPQPNELVYPAR